MTLSPLPRAQRALSWIAVGGLALMASCHDGSSSNSAGDGGGGGNPTLGGPAITGLLVDPGVDQAVVRFSTSVPAIGCVEYGPNPAYGQLLCGTELATEHELLISPLDPDTQYHFRVTAEDALGRTTATDDDTFRTLSAGAFLSDDFSRANLFPSPWSWIDPQFKAYLRMVDAGTQVARVELTAAEGFDYSVSGSNGAVRLSQPMLDEDFTAETKILSAVSTPDGESGLFFEESADDYVRFGFVFDGTDVLLRAAHVAGGAVAAQDQLSAFFGSYDGSGRILLRVARSGDQWTSEYSFDGTVFLPGPMLTAPLSLAACGPYAANGPGSDADHVAAFDYIFEASRPIEDEDGAVRIDDQPPFVYRSKAQAMPNAEIRVRWWSDEPAAGTLDYGQDSSFSEGSTDQEELGWFNQHWIYGLLPETGYYVQLRARDELGQEVVVNDYLLKTTPIIGNTRTAQVGQDTGEL